MKFSIALCSTLFAASALGSTLRERIDRRATRTRATRPVEKLEPAAAQAQDTGDKNVQYSSNWAGAVYESPPSGTFTAVSGRITVPTPSSSGGSGEQAASAWVGIDGDTYTNAILQGGVDFYVDGGSVSYDAWYEWYPDYAYDFSGIDISAGDVLLLSVKSTSSRAGSVTIENETTGQTVTKSLTSSSALGGQNAEWIVEDFEENGSLVPFANFGTVVFSSASASTNTETVGASGAQIIEIENSRGSVITDVSVSSSSVTVKYV